VVRVLRRVHGPLTGPPLGSAGAWPNGLFSGEPIHLIDSVVLFSQEALVFPGTSITAWWLTPPGGVARPHQRSLRKEHHCRETLCMSTAGVGRARAGLGAPAIRDTVQFVTLALPTLDVARLLLT
jgi:hypothetical protein